MELDATTLGVIGTSVAGLLTGVGTIMAGMWKGRQTELRLARERVGVLETARDTRLREQQDELDEAQRQLDDARKVFDVRLAQLEDEASERHRAMRSFRERNGNPPRADDDEAAEAVHLNALELERRGLTEGGAPDRMSAPREE